MNADSSLWWGLSGKRLLCWASLAAALLFCAMAVLGGGPAPAAWADQSLHAGRTQAPLAVQDGGAYPEREDHGWIYRLGDYWFRTGVEPTDTNTMFTMVDGRAYFSIYTFTPDYVSFGEPWVMYYRDAGELVFQGGNYYDMDRVIAVGPSWNHDDPYDALEMGPYIYKMTEIEGLSAGTGDTPFHESVKRLAKNIEAKPEYRSHAFSPRKIVFDTQFERYVENAQLSDDSYLYPYDANYHAQCFRTWASVFKGLGDVTAIEGIGELDLEVVDLARAFSGCEKLRELDLSGLDTRECSNFADMFADCGSLVQLTLGPKWSQANAEAGERARFPVSMSCGEGSAQVAYEAGDIIPDGAAVYVALAHVDMASAHVQLFEPGTLVVDERRFEEYASGKVALPEGVTLDDVHVWQPGDAGDPGDGGDADDPGDAGDAGDASGTGDAGDPGDPGGTGDPGGQPAGFDEPGQLGGTDSSALPQFRYTGKQVKPALAVEADGRLLLEGQDFRAVYSNDVEDGTAQVKLVGLGDCYGVLAVEYQIVDPDAYAYLYDNGLLVVKCDHHPPSNWRLTYGAALSARMKWFAPEADDAGASVPWATRASEVKRVVFDESFEKCKARTARKWFAGCTALESVEGWEHLDASAMTDVSEMFSGCTSLEALSLIGLDDSRLQNFAGFCEGCSSLESITFGKCDLAAATDIHGFFAGCSSLPYAKLGKLDLAQVQDASGLFADCSSLALVDCASMDLAAAKNASRMFAGCTSLSALSLKGLELPRAQNVSAMFEGCVNLERLDMAAIALPEARDASAFLSGCGCLERLDMTGVKLPKVTDLHRAFAGCARLETLNLGDLGLPALRDVEGMLANCATLATVRFGDLDVSGAVGADGLLESCPELTSFEMGAGWKNASEAQNARPLGFPMRAYRISPAYASYGAGARVPDGAGEYRLREIALQFVTVFMEKPAFECTGLPVEPKPAVRLGSMVLQDGVDYTLTYENNLHPGKASMTITGKGAFSGGLIVPFTLVAPVTEVGDRLVYVTKKATYTFEVTSASGSEGASRATVKLVGVNVTSNKLKTLSIPSQCTVGDIMVTVTSINSKLVGDFRNVKSVIIGANVVRIGGWAFSGAPSVKRLVVQSGRLTSVKNCLAGSNVKRVTTQVWLTNAKRAKYKKWFTKKAGKRGVKFMYG